MTETTVLQKWECTDDSERAFNKNKQMCDWTLSSAGAAALDDKKLEIANSLFDDNRFGSHYTTLERCSHFYKASQKIMIDRGEWAGLSVWDAVV